MPTDRAAIAASGTGEHLLRQQTFTPERDEPFDVQVAGMQRLEPQCRLPPPTP